MMPTFSPKMLDDLNEAVRTAEKKSEVLHLRLVAEKIRARNETDNVALEDVVAELMRRAARSGVTMEISADWR